MKMMVMVMLVGDGEVDGVGGDTDACVCMFVGG